MPYKDIQWFPFLGCPCQHRHNLAGALGARPSAGKGTGTAFLHRQPLLPSGSKKGWPGKPVSVIYCSCPDTDKKYSRQQHWECHCTNTSAPVVVDSSLISCPSDKPASYTPLRGAAFWWFSANSKYAFLMVFAEDSASI